MIPILLLLLIPVLSPPVHAEVFHISQGRQFADGTINLRRWFFGTKLEFKAAFNESNIYTLPGDEQADSNKLFGFADCASYAGESSARFGWRWYKDRLEITAVTHYDGTWHLHQIMGVAELNRVYDFEIELSADKSHYLYTFNHGVPVAMKRDCQADQMLGYFLYPFFGGSEKAPQDMTVSVWTEPKANLVLEKAGPNPLISGQPLRTRLRVGEPMRVQFQLFDVAGRRVHETAPTELQPSSEPVDLEVPVPVGLASAVYFLRPVQLRDSDELPAYVLGDGGDSFKLLILR